MAINSTVGGSNSGALIRKRETILSSKNWMAPAKLANDTAWITGCGGGGSGARSSSFYPRMGGFGGAYVENYPVTVRPNDTVAVVVGAGGTGVTSGNVGNQGGTSSFGTLYIQGGSGGYTFTETLAGTLNLRGISPVLVVGPNSNTSYTQVHPSQTVNGNVCGLTDTRDSAICTGGAAGYFGNGGVGGQGTTGGNDAAANTGAGGGAQGSALRSGAGGSGRIVVEWEEYP